MIEDELEPSMELVYVRELTEPVTLPGSVLTLPEYVLTLPESVLKEPLVLPVELAVSTWFEVED